MRALPFLALALVACTAGEPNQEPTPRTPPSRGHHPREPPTFPPVAADDEHCSACIRNDFGECRLERLGYCPGGPRGVHEACEYEVPCPESCCDRFPILGGVALLRPGHKLWDYGYQRERVEVASVPRTGRGLLVRVIDMNPDPDPDPDVLRVRTIGRATPPACKGAVDDLEGVILWADVERKSLKPAPRKCREAVYALGNPDDRDLGIDSRGLYKYDFDPSAYGASRVVKAWTPIDFPLRQGDPTTYLSGVVIEHIVLDHDEPLEPVHGLLCYRLPGILRPRVCSEPEAIHNAPRNSDAG